MARFNRSTIRRMVRQIDAGKLDPVVLGLTDDDVSTMRDQSQMEITLNHADCERVAKALLGNTEKGKFNAPKTVSIPKDIAERFVRCYVDFTGHEIDVPAAPKKARASK